MIMWSVDDVCEVEGFGFGICSGGECASGEAIMYVMREMASLF